MIMTATALLGAQSRIQREQDVRNELAAQSLPLRQPCPRARRRAARGAGGLSHDALPRRRLFQGAAGLVVAFSLPAQAEACPPRSRPTAWTATSPSHRTAAVTVYAGKVDIGTGARAALRQIVAEELGDVPRRHQPWSRATPALTPDQGGTGGSTGISVGGMQIRQAAATARAACCEWRPSGSARPAADLAMAGLDPSQGRPVRRRRGTDRRPDFRAFGRQDRPAKNPASYTIVGTSYARPDLPAKLTARHTYVHDHRVDGMLHARVIRPPAIGAHLLDVDASVDRRASRTPASCESRISSPSSRRANGTRSAPCGH